MRAIFLALVAAVLAGCVQPADLRADGTAAVAGGVAVMGTNAVFGAVQAARGIVTRIDVPYDPGPAPAAVAGAAAEAVSVTGQDRRGPEGAAVGIILNQVLAGQGPGAKNGFPIVVTNDLPATVASGLGQTLTAQGYRLAPTGAQVVVQLVRATVAFRLDHALSYADGRIAVVVKVLDGAGHLDFAHYYETAGMSLNDSVLWSADGRSARESLIAALRSTVQAVAVDPQFQAAVRSAQPRAAT